MTEEKLKRKVERLELLVQQFSRYFWVEQGWEAFRSEMILKKGDEKTTKEKNARAIVDFLKEMAEENPEYKELILTPNK